MILRLVFVSIVLLGFIPMNSKAEGSATFYIIDSGYLEYRQKLNSEAASDAASDPIIMKRLEDGDLSLQEFFGLIKAEIEPKLKIYREEHGLDENGAKKK